MKTARATAFSGPPSLHGRRRLPTAPARHHTVRLPRSVVSELGRAKQAAARAADGGVGAAIGTLERTLLQRATMGPRTDDAERIGAIGYDAWLDEQLDYEALDDSELEEALHDALPTLGMSATELYSAYSDNPAVPILELWTATVYRALYSPRQLFERMAIFWSDHFSIDILADFQYVLKPVDEREVIRAHAMGNFAELLSASAHSPAMLLFLTNDTNSKNFPNENYARELMELHTMGADRGYTEKDVKEVARCFTGWTFQSPRADHGTPLGFTFAKWDHDSRKKKVLGKTIPAGGGVEDGERVLSILVKRKETREYLATKLLRYLWGYEPKKTAIRKVMKAYQKSDGDIRDMVRKALTQERLASTTVKIKRPFHLYVSALRALYADAQNVRGVLEALSRAGHLPFNWEAPNGYPDDPLYWSGFLLPRWNFGADLLTSARSGIAIDSAIDSPDGTPSEIVDRLDALLFGGTMTEATRTELIAYLGKGKQNRKRVRDTIGLAIGAPEFQEY